MKRDWCSRCGNAIRLAVQVTHGLSNKRKLVEVQAPQLTVAGVRVLLWNE